MMLILVLGTIVPITSCGDDFHPEDNTSEKTDDNGKDEDKGNAPKEAKAVDLGLSVKWANINIGATAPEEYGAYYAWGETQEKKTYYDENYFDYIDGSYTGYNKYAIDKKMVLDSQDDAAHVVWGGKWRMPTKEEQDELVKNCTWTWVKQNGVQGCLMTSKINGNSIFLPATGVHLGNKYYDYEQEGGYWTKSLVRDNSQAAYMLEFGDRYCGWNYGGRICGRSIRAVCR